MPGLGELLGSAVAGLPDFFGEVFARDPGTWSLIILAMAGLLALSLVRPRRRSRRRR